MNEAEAVVRAQFEWINKYDAGGCFFNPLNMFLKNSHKTLFIHSVVLVLPTMSNIEHTYQENFVAFVIFCNTYNF